MGLDDAERGAEQRGVVENDPLSGEVKDLDQLDGKQRRITSEMDTMALQGSGKLPQLELQDMVRGGLNDSTAYITFEPAMRRIGLADENDPFQKEWVDKDEGTLEGLWRGVKGLFGASDTLEDKAKERVLEGLTPEQREQYEKEEAELSAWKTREATMMSIAYQGSPMPDCPMHRQVERQVAQFEQGVRAEVLREMTPEQRAELEREQQEYDREWRENNARTNPLGGPLHQPDPKPGPTMEYYKKMVQKRAEERLG